MKIINGDSLEVLKRATENSVDSIVCDPPYGLSFMGKKWDYDVPSTELWVEAMRVLKPGGHLLSFAGSRTYHRMAVNIEDAGFEIRDQIMWVYGVGFPKSHNIYKSLQKSCTCGIMEEYDNEKTEQKTEHSVQSLQETDIPKTFSNKETEEHSLQSSVQEHNVSTTNKTRGSVFVSEGGEKSSLERGSNIQESERELQGSNLPEVSREVSGNGEEGRIHNATQISDGSTPEQITNENGSSTSRRPQSEQQQDRKPCSLCDKWGTQKVRSTAEAIKGFGTALKPAHEPIVVARKPLSEKTIAKNVLEWGTGGINIDGCRVETDDSLDGGGTIDKSNYETVTLPSEAVRGRTGTETGGRFPANFIHDGSDEVVGLFPETKCGGSNYAKGTRNNWLGENKIDYVSKVKDSGSASRFFYCAKASKKDRNEGLEGFETSEKFTAGNYSQSPTCKTCNKTLNGTNDHSSCSGEVYYKEMESKNIKNNHPTVKPTDLMQYLVRLVTPKGGTVLDPFMGSGSTGKACKLEGFDFIGIELDPEYCKIAQARIDNVKL